MKGSQARSAGDGSSDVAGTSVGQQPGDRVGEYILECLVGQGGFGNVWRARHAVLPGKTVAIKLPRDPELLELLRRESLLQHGLDHAGVLRVLGVDLDTDPPYIVQEYAPGGDLARLLRERGALPARRAMELFREAVRVIAAAHASGVVHGDLKPGNILLDGDGRVRVADFGLGHGIPSISGGVAEHHGSHLSVLTDRLLAAGTWEYMSPERRALAVGDPDAPRPDARVDVYALGIILHELLTGERPAGRVGLEHVSPGVDHVFARSWTSLDRRYRDAGELLADLDRVLGGTYRAPEPSAPPAAMEPAPSAAPLPQPVPASSTGSTPPPRQDATNPRPRPRRRSPRYSGIAILWQRIAVLAPLLVIAGAVYFVWVGGAMKKRHPPKLPPAPEAQRDEFRTEGAGREISAIDAAAIERSKGDAQRLAAVRDSIEAEPGDVDGALALLDGYISVVRSDALRKKAVDWRNALVDATEERVYRVQLRGYSVDQDDYREKFNTGIEPGGPDVYVSVTHVRDGEETQVFSNHKSATEKWAHRWDEGDAPPAFDLRWRRGDALLVEIREADLFGDNTIAEFAVDGGYSIVVVSRPLISDAGHEVELDSDFAFGK